MLTQFRHLLVSAAALGAIWAGAALAQWPTQQVARLEPGYGGVCEACDLSGRILAGARMNDSVFDRSNFTNAVLARVDASRSEFEGANFTRADLRYARLMGAQLRGATLTGANLSGADLRGALGLTQTQLNQACGDDQTRLPRGLRVEACE